MATATARQRGDDVTYRRLLPGTRLYQRAVPDVETVPVEEMTRERFLRHFVSRNRPVLIKGAARHFPAVERWTLEYISTRFAGDRRTLRHVAPLPREWAAWADRDATRRLIRRSQVADSLPDAIRHLQSGDHYTVIRETLWSDALDDLGAFPFLTVVPGLRKLLYPSHTVYLYRNCLTDWHYHPASEALMTQIRGTKEVLLLDPLDRSWRALTPYLHASPWSWRGNEAEFPGLADLVPRLVRVEAGDSLFIPVWWWHTVEAIDSAFGITVPHWWGASLRQSFHPKFPGSSHALWWDLPKSITDRTGWRREPRVYLARLLVALAAWATVGPFHWLTSRIVYRRTPV